MPRTLAARRTGGQDKKWIKAFGASEPPASEHPGNARRLMAGERVGYAHVRLFPYPAHRSAAPPGDFRFRPGSVLLDRRG
ncbi:hypothetical protein CHL67_09690 [Prosthecochloris sp. GSB1]|nr:hypothetical protein CHL67_09690 [Prosthecochloris sp. GSB1]